MDDLNLRLTCIADEPDLAALYAAAFPKEDLMPIVRRLLAEEPAALSLAAGLAGRVVGHVLFTPCIVGDGGARVALLAPLAVAPAWQRRGVGRALVNAGFLRLRRTGLRRVLVLGDPAYYARLGFAPERAIVPPYRLPPEWSDAWQSVALDDGAETLAGVLRPPAAWLSPALWAP